ncbi:hypothetical protein OUZ56_027478 [Daphnia magna]|uniref:Uncharacterized protein n=1 Tax=Daphnia magna TaxID=35525 RepID=A0ABQ9ZQK0_9CRUS|nr:hypothetical protein OUZ56_027478 [Daphnia magna]
MSGTTAQMTQWIHSTSSGAAWSSTNADPLRLAFCFTNTPSLLSVYILARNGMRVVGATPEKTHLVFSDITRRLTSMTSSKSKAQLPFKTSDRKSWMYGPLDMNDPKSIGMGHLRHFEVWNLFLLVPPPSLATCIT